MSTPTTKLFSEFNSELRKKGFNVFQFGADNSSTRIYSRKEFYKICLTTGKGKIHYADRSYDAQGTVLFFGNPHVPYSWETLSGTHIGYTCLFSEDFFKFSDRSESPQQSPLFKSGGIPILAISDEQRNYLNSIFQKMIDEQKSDYLFKYDLIKSFINLIIHQALKMQPLNTFDLHKNAAARITSIFLELLERQFPIESRDHPLQLKTANDFAIRIFVHVNHLNRSVKEITGKSTTTIITHRITEEAKALLQYTNWTVSEIAYALNFDYPTYFNNYFKRVTGRAPLSHRLQTA